MSLWLNNIELGTIQKQCEHQDTCIEFLSQKCNDCKNNINLYDKDGNLKHIKSSHYQSIFSSK